jgi:hypothetical protein
VGAVKLISHLIPYDVGSCVIPNEVRIGLADMHEVDVQIVTGRDFQQRRHALEHHGRDLGKID